MKWRLELAVTDLGQTQLKNIAEPGAKPPVTGGFCISEAQRSGKFIAQFLCVRITGNPAAAAHPAFPPRRKLMSHMALKDRSAGNKNSAPKSMELSMVWRRSTYSDWR